jgi:hypothetical protein
MRKLLKGEDKDLNRDIYSTNLQKEVNISINKIEWIAVKNIL